MEDAIKKKEILKKKEDEQKESESNKNISENPTEMYLKTFNRKVKKEKKTLNNIFKSIENSKRPLCETLIDRLAWLTVSVQFLEKSISDDGQKIYYDNGGGQSGWKTNPDVNTLVAYNKQITTITKQLIEIAPADANLSGSKLEHFLDYGNEE